MTGLSKTLAATGNVWTKLGAPKTPPGIGLIPTTVDGPHEAPVRLITTVLLPLRNTRNNPEAPAEVPTVTHALVAGKAAARTDANVDARITRTVPLPPRNTRNDPEAPTEVPTATRAPVTSKAAARIDANADARINERITPWTG